MSAGKGMMKTYWLTEVPLESMKGKWNVKWGKSLIKMKFLDLHHESSSFAKMTLFRKSTLIIPSKGDLMPDGWILPQI